MSAAAAMRVEVAPLTPGPLAERVLDLAATGRAGLSALLGDAAQRQALFRPRIRPECFLAATVEGELAGYLSLKLGGRGPFAPGFADFRRCYGWRRGLHAFLVFSAIEARSRALPGGAYVYGIDVLEPFRGRARFPPHGVGGALLLAASAWAAARGLDRLEAEVRAPASAALFRRMGARPMTARPFSLGRLLMATAGDYERLCIPLRG
ncbi:GNAT family N-acetyltransferase [Rubritepida flocculans]|uniref:GNAT family N-acetyltransferase n=1 Tax=Rubritepida flocculans TaxID=182403 RepID=UPI00041843ED|nr:GNAT family N-acetyltransferase [Rubritepida flocculans]